ncbi:MAG: ABC transporter ATP-binding protein, partial [Desulfobacterales bacterium]|nr:ABC transporter ATP-binding protein [Desulfobacterales bacterium]
MTAIHFDNIKKTFRHGIKRQTVLHDISLAVNRGEIFGFLGPNGAGKSTAIKLLLNFIRPDKGNISVEELVVGKDRFRHLIGYLPETPCFYENLTGLESLWFAGKASGMQRQDIRKGALDALQRLDLKEAGAWPVRTYSKGMKQRLGLAMALVHDPRIFILDEPMSGLDPMGRR